jgi:hypothetical protein
MLPMLSASGKSPYVGCCCRRQEAAERWGRAAAESVEGREGLRLRRLDVLHLRDHSQDETSRATTNTLADLAIAAAATSLGSLDYEQGMGVWKE